MDDVPSKGDGQWVVGYKMMGNGRRVMACVFCCREKEVPRSDHGQDK